MTDNNLLPVFDTMKSAWEKVKGSKGTIWCLYLILIVISGVLGGIGFAIGNQAIFAILNIIVMIISLFFFFSFIYLGIQRAQGLPIRVGIAKNVMTVGVFFRMVGLYLLKGFIFLMCGLAIGLLVTIFAVLLSLLNLPYLTQTLIMIFSIVMGVLMIGLALRFYLAVGMVIANEMNPWDALVASFSATKGNVCRIIGLILLNFLIVFISVIPFGIGLIWTIPYSLICYGEVYRRLFISRHEIAVKPL